MTPPAGGDTEMLNMADSAVDKIDEAELAVHPEESISQMLAIASTIQVLDQVYFRAPTLAHPDILCFNRKL